MDRGKQADEAEIDIPRRNSSDPTSSSSKTTGDGDKGSMQNLRGVFLSKEEREKQGLGKKGDVRFSFPFSTHSYFFLGGGGKLANHVWWYTESSWRSRSNEVGECAWYVLSNVFLDAFAFALLDFIR